MNFTDDPYDDPETQREDHVCSCVDAASGT